MQPTNSRDAFNELQTFQKSRRKSQDVLKESENRLGLPSATQRQAGLRAAITNTENLIRSVEPSVSGRTSGSLVTEAQKTRLVGLERQPLDESFREQSRAFEGETSNINELNRRALQDTQLALTEDDSRENSLRGLYGTLYQREQDDIAKAERERAAAEATRQFNEQLAHAKRSAASSNSLAGLLAGGGGQTSAPAGPSAAELNAAKRVNTLRQLEGIDLATAIRDLRTQARMGDQTSKLIAQKYYQSIGAKIPFAEFR